jgi:adhesin/invasin
MSHAGRGSALLSLVLALALGACPCAEDNDGCVTTEPSNEYIRIWGGDGQIAAPGAALADPIQVTHYRSPAEDPNYAGVAGHVYFRVISGGGQVGANRPGSTLDDHYDTGINEGSDGVASARWVLGPSLGRQTVRVTFENHKGYLEFTATAHGPAVQMVAYQGQNQTATIGTKVVRPAVKIVDEQGVGVPGVLVEFTGPLYDESERTDQLGVARMPSDWTVGTAATTYVRVATARENAPSLQPLGIFGNPVTFTVNAVAAAPERLVVSAGLGQVALPSTAVQTPPAVRLVDHYGNPVVGVQVTFARVTPGGSISDSTPRTGPDGIAALGQWILGPAEGDYRLDATADGAGIVDNPATFRATASLPSGPPARIYASRDAPAAARAGYAVPFNQLPIVRVVDANGRPVRGFQLTFRAGAGSGTIGGATSAVLATNANGEAGSPDWILSRVAGQQYLTVSETIHAPLTGSPVVFTVNALPGPVAKVAKASPDQLQVPVSLALSAAQRPKVVVKDEFDNPIANVTVTFVVVAGGGSATGTTVQTGINGEATVGSWTMGNSAGQNRMQATAAGFTVEFVMNAGSVAPVAAIR